MAAYKDEKKRNLVCFVLLRGLDRSQKREK